ncbi:hypothetical protein MTO96_018581 [Rhipicephalus appendiculatus]
MPGPKCAVKSCRRRAPVSVFHFTRLWMTARHNLAVNPWTLVQMWIVTRVAVCFMILSRLWMTARHNLAVNPWTLVQMWIVTRVAACFMILSRDGTALHQESKYIVFESCLWELLSVCDQCGDTCTIRKHTKGTFLTVKATCFLGHEKAWYSQPTTNGMAAGNVLLAGAILFSGASAIKVFRLLASVNIEVFTASAYNIYQKGCLVPAITKVHLGQGVFMDKDKWPWLLSRPKDSLFCKEATKLLWGVSAFRNRSITGAPCRRFAKTENQAPPRRALRPLKLEAVASANTPLTSFYSCHRTRSTRLQATTEAPFEELDNGNLSDIDSEFDDLDNEGVWPCGFEEAPMQSDSESSDEESALDTSACWRRTSFKAPDSTYKGDVDEASELKRVALPQ